jgi:hypothetical protein
MAVYVTEDLRRRLAAANVKAEDFANWFAAWKRSGEWSSHMFGRDSAYVLPKVGNLQYRLRHVHLIPVLDAEARRKWEKHYAAERPRTSDRILIYVQHDDGDFLLIAILPEPDAHEVQRMANAADKALMESFAHVADEFLMDKAVVI